MLNQILFTLIVRGLLIAAGFISSVVTARYLGQEGRGLFYYWSTIALLFIQFGNFGLHSSNSYYLAKKKAKLSVLASNSLCISCIAGLCFGCAFLLFLYFTGKSITDNLYFVIPVLIMIPTGLFFLLGTRLFIALDNIRDFNILELFNRYLVLGCIAIVGYWLRTPEALLMCSSISGVIMCLVVFFRLQKVEKCSWPDFAIFLKGLSYSMRAYISASIAFLVMRVNLFYIDKYTLKSTLGVWSIASQMIDVIQIIPGTVAIVLLPKILRDNQPYQLMIAQRRIVGLVLCCVCIIVVFIGYEFILFFYGKQFSRAYEMILWGLPGTIFLGIIGIHSQYLAAKGLPSTLIWIWLIGLLFEIVFSYAIIPTYGAIGAMLSLSVTYLIILVGIVLLSKSIRKTELQQL